MHLPYALRALGSRDYRLYFFGQMISVAGTWMQQVAMGWLAYRLTESALVLGLLGFASQVPILLLGPFGGVWSDRLDRRRLMMLSQSLAMLQALALALLTWRGWITPHLLLALAFIAGCINALDIPARQSLVVHLVAEREHLPNAIALNSFVMNATRFVGPTLAGFVIALAGEALCFAFNALSYLAVLLALFAIRVRPGGNSSKPALHALGEGLRYTFGHRDIRNTLALVAAVAFTVTPYVVMMPLYVKTIFHGDATVLGFMIGSAGIGSLSASLTLANSGSIDRLACRVALAAMAAGVALALFSLNSHALLAYPILMAMGYSVILVAAGSNTLLQNWVRDDMRGRVMATFSMAFLGVAPLGSFAVGALSQGMGVRSTLFLCGSLTLVAGLFHFHRLRRRGGQKNT